MIGKRKEREQQSKTKVKVKKKRKRHLRKYKAASFFGVKQTGNRRRREEVKGKEEEELLFLNPEFFLRVTLEAKDCEKNIQNSCLIKLT